MNQFLIILTAIAMTISVVEDIRRMKIPNWVTFPTMLLAVLFHSVSDGFGGFIYGVSGLATGIGLFIVPYLMGGMGAGDAKLMGATGAILGPKGVVAASVVVILFGGLYGVILLALNPTYGVSFARRLWAMLKTTVLTCRFYYIPPAEEDNQPILRYAIPIAFGALSYVVVDHLGYDLFRTIFDSAFGKLSI
jgi:prepilin peptidase CpaA